MKKAGVACLGFGLESASDRILAKMGKPYNSEMAERVIRHAFETGLHVNANLILGFPGETPEDVQATRDFVECNSKYLVGGISFPSELGVGGNSPVCRSPEKFGIDADTLTDRLSWSSLDGKQTHQSRLKLIDEFEVWTREKGILVHERPIAPPDVHMDAPQDSPPYSKD